MKQLHGYCLAVILMFILLKKLCQIKCVLLTMQSLFIIGMFKLLISIVMPLLV